MEQIILPCLYAFVGCAAFCFVFQLRKWQHIVCAALSGAGGWLVYLLLEGSSIVLRGLLATVVVAVLSEIFARVFKSPAAVFLLIGIIPLVPGGGIYYTLEALINSDMDLFVEKGMETVALAGAIAVGCSLVASVVRIISKSRQRRTK
ncbi:MAG: threonine/serine exporter [Ruminococcaceae bacterium]|nr:threonine/serine exporter [Oscillospiraceae bacterium]